MIQKEERVPLNGCPVSRRAKRKPKDWTKPVGVASATPTVYPRYLTGGYKNN